MRKPLTYTYQSQFLEMFGGISNSAALTDICSPKQWKTIPTKDFTVDGFLVYGANGVIGRYPEYNHEKPTILIACRGASCGTINVSQPKSYITGNAMCLDNVNEDYTLDFLSFYLRIYDFTSIITGGAQPQITRENLAKVKVIKPQIEAQKRFSIIYRQADKSKFDGFKSQFLEMFGNNPLWEYKPLKDIIHEDCQISYGIVQPGDDVEDGIPIVRPVDMTSNLYLGKNGLKKTSKNISDAYKRTILRGDEVLLCVRGTTGLVNLAENELKGCNVTRGITPLFFKENIDPRYIYCILMSPNAQQYIADHTHGSTLKGINMEDVRNLPIPMPPEGVQKQCVSILIQADKSKYYELN